MPVTRDDEGSLRRQRTFEDAIIIRIIHDYVNHNIGHDQRAHAPQDGHCRELALFRGRVTPTLLAASNRKDEAWWVAVFRMGLLPPGV